MRRSDREVNDINEIFSMLQSCDSLNLGMADDGMPYVIPMTFGCEMNDGIITVYLHSAQSGRKCDILQRNPNVCVEAHKYYRTEEANGEITAKYESIIGTGKAVKLEEGDKVAAFKIMLEHYNNSGFPVENCKGLLKSDVYKIELEQVSGKRNI